MYAVISGEKTFILFPPTDYLYFKEQSYPTQTYHINVDNTNTNSNNDNNSNQEVPSYTHRIKSKDVTLSSQNCSNSTSTLTWISDNIDNHNCYELNSNFKYTHPIRCTVRQGEILYIPSMWYHQVSQNTLTIAVNFWYDQRFDFRYATI
jgi:jumonji domain-containing protein 7